jgi:hypothetical protein
MLTRRQRRRADKRRPTGQSVLPRQQAPAHQELVGLTRGLAALGDGRDYEVGAQPGVAGDEDPGLPGAVAVLGVDRAAVRVAEVHLFEEAIVHRSGEADGEQYEIGLYLEVRALFWDRLAIRRPLGLDGVHLLDVAVRSRETRDGDGEAALAALFVGGVGVEDEVSLSGVSGGLGPWVRTLTDAQPSR